MKIETTIHQINEYCNANNLPKARSLIERNWSLIIELDHYIYLNYDAQYLVTIIKDEIEKGGFHKLSLDEKRILNQMNQYVRDLRYSHAKRTYIQHKHLFDRTDAHNWLTAEAKMLCDAFTSNT